MTQDKKDILSNRKAMGNLCFSFIVIAIELLDAFIIVKLFLKPAIIPFCR